jgi:Leucine-rich repeat (LRR) protein
VLLIAAAPGIIPWRLVAQQAEPAVQAARVAPINPATPSGEDKNTAAPPGKRVHGEAHHRAVAELEKLGALVYSDAARGTTVVIADHWTGGDAPLALLPDVDDLKVLILNGAKVTPAGFVNLRRLPSSTLLQLTDATEDQIASLKGAENLTGLMISGDRLTDAGLAALATLPNLKNLQIIQNGKDSAVTDAGIAALKTCAELVQLGISGCSKVTGCTLGELAGLPRLQDLWLLQIPLADEGFSQLAKLPRLKRLTVTASLKTDSGVVTQVTPAGFGALKKLTSLERLSLNEAIGLDDTAAANLANLRELRLLRLAQVKLTDAGLAHLAGLTNLRELAVWNGNYTDAGLAHLKGLAKMRRLSISGNANISDTALRNLAAMTDLRRLELTSNRLTDDSLTALAEFKALESLGLPGLRIRGTGLERITGLAKLRNISLGRSLITDDQLPVFAQFPALEELDLADTAITDAGLASLGRLQKLTRLELVDTKITDAGLEKLDGLKQLRNLGLAGTQVTKSGVQRLNQKLPQLQIGADWTVAFGTLQLDVADDEPAAADAAKPEAAKSEAKPVAVTPDKAGAVEKRGPQEDNVLRKLRLDGARLLAQMVKEAGYALPADRDLLRVPPPFSPLRAEYYRVGHPHQADSIPTGASAMVFHWEKNSLRNWGMTFSVSVPPGAGYNLTGLVDGLLGIKDQMIDVPADLLEEQIPGDWVIRPRVADEQIIRQLDAILQNELSLKLHMEFRQVPRRVYVARGNYRLTPLPGNSGKDTTSYEDKTVETDRIEIFSKHLIPDSGSGGGTGKFDEFLDWLGQWVGAPIVSEVGTRPKGEVTWRLHGRSPFTKEMRAEDRDASQVLANITAQTGLTFKEETRSVKILFVESTK